MHHASTAFHFSSSLYFQWVPFSAQGDLEPLPKCLNKDRGEPITGISFGDFFLTFNISLSRGHLQASRH